MTQSKKKSRSFKKPYITDQQGASSTKEVKRRANRKIRGLDVQDDFVSGRIYRKYFDSWNIRDYSFYQPDYKKAYRK